MGARKLLAPLAMAALALAMTAGAHAGSTVVGEDPAGDWGMGDPDADPILAEIGPQLGQDLVSAAIEIKPDVVEFTIKVTSLPANGGVPELTRYVWDMEVNGTKRELDGKFTNYSRGACDPTAGSCPPPRDPGTAPFSVRGNCTTTGSVTTCQEIGLVHATFDPAAGTIVIPVPRALLGEGCLTIAPGLNTFQTGGESISATPSAFFTSGNFPMDLMLLDTTVSDCA